MVQEAIAQLNTVSKTVEVFRGEMNRLAMELPEYEIVMSLYGTGKSLDPQLMAEIGDVRRFAHKGSLTAFADVDPGANQSGAYEAKSTHASKSGSPELRKTLFVLMTALLQNAPPDDPVFQFLDKKRAEGKPYYVYMTAGCYKFLRIYYGNRLFAVTLNRSVNNLVYGFRYSFWVSLCCRQAYFSICPRPMPKFPKPTGRFFVSLHPAKCAGFINESPFFMPSTIFLGRIG